MSNIETARSSAARAVEIRIPASTSNLGAGFDAVGVALNLYLRVLVERADQSVQRIEFSGVDARLVPADDTNLVWRVMKTVADRHGRTLPAFRMRVRNEIPITKGLGSSASACLAGVVAADFLCGLGLERGEWLDLASGLEGHPDNAAPSLYGGFVVSLKGETIQCARCEFPADWTIVAVTPELELETRTARAVLPAQVPHRHAVMNVQHAAFLVAQIIRGRKEGLRAAMEDYLHQPYRADLIPGLREILAIDPQDGLLGVALSGAGPTVIALADRNESRIGDRIREIFGKNGLASQVRALKADRLGLTCEAAEVSP